MLKSILTFIMTLFCLNTVSYAQLPYQFTNTARNIHYGFAWDVGVSNDGTIFLANGFGGLRAYKYNGNSFTSTGQINNGGKARGVVISSDGTVFLIDDNLWAFRYDGNSFINTAHIDDDGDYPAVSYAKGVAVDSVGTVFLANGHDGLRAYSYDGNSFTNTAHINNNASGEADLEGASGVAVSSDGTIFLANGSKGMFAYTYSPASGFENNFSAVPQNHSLSQNYPNPFNESTTIFYTLKESAMVSLKIYDLLGREIKTLVNEFQDESNYSINFNGSGLRSGIYYYQLQIGNKFTETKKMVLLR